MPPATEPADCPHCGANCPHCGADAVGASGRCARCLKLAYEGAGRPDRPPWYQLDGRPPSRAEQACFWALVAFAGACGPLTASLRQLGLCAVVLPLGWLARGDLWRLMLWTAASVVAVPVTVSALLTVWALGLYAVVFPFSPVFGWSSAVWSVYAVGVPAALVGGLSLLLVRLTRPRVFPRPWWVAGGDLVAFASIHLLGALIAFDFYDLSWALP